MGIASSQSSANGAQATSSGDIIRKCHCYSISYLSLDRRCIRHSLTFNHSGDKTAINPKTKKKRSYGFATFKKKLIGKRRHFKGSDHGRCFREHFIDCPSDILKSLLGQYEALTMLKDLSVQADLARPPAQTLGQSLGELFEAEICCDITLVYNGFRIPAHKSILMARCPYFSRHLAFHNSKEFHVRTRNSGSVPSLTVLKTVLKYLYTGNADLLNSTHAEALALLEDEFGIPNSLESDVSFLLETLSLGDLRLMFDDQSHPEYLCHRTIIAARTPFLARILNKKQSENDVMDLHLDSTIIPGKYALVILHAIYMDTLDFRLIENGQPTVSESGVTDETQSEAYVQDAMNLYEIGRFLEFNFLAQSCEDMLMQYLNINNVVSILNWSLNPYGSSWIAKQAYQFLEEEFFTISSSSSILGSLSKDTMMRILKSDFVQASESEVLQALIKWGEFQLSKENAAQRDVVSTATLGRNKSGATSKRKEICDSELKELISSMITQVRVPHVLQRDRTSEVLDMALTRNLFSVLPNFTSQVNVATKYSPWDPKANNGLFVRPRLFLPYFEECKKLIQDRCQDPEIVSSNSPCVSVPDTLYMLRRKKTEFGSTDDLMEVHTSTNTKVPDNEIISKMMERMKKLISSHSVQRAFSSNFVDVNEVMSLVEKRVVREFGFPDSYSSILQKARRRSMSTTELSDTGRLSNTFVYHVNPQIHSKSHLEESAFNQTGPDVTLATNAVSSLTIFPQMPQDQESPDLVSIGSESLLGATALHDGSSSTPATTSTRHFWKSSVSASSQNTNTARKMSHSYCTGPSHMYL